MVKVIENEMNRYSSMISTIMQSLLIAFMVPE